MPKSVTAIELDNGLSETAKATRMDAFGATPPTDYTDLTNNTLATVVMAPGDFTLEAGDTANGRKLTIGGKSDIDVVASGTAEHVVLSVSGETRLLAITTCSPLALTAGGGNKVTFPTWKREIPQPT